MTDRPFAGRFHDLGEPIIRPQPLARPHPPIMIGGNGERRTLRLVARYADACNFLILEPDEIRAKLEVLRAHCDEIGRDYGEIEITALDEVDLRPGTDVGVRRGRPCARPGRCGRAAPHRQHARGLGRSTSRADRPRGRSPSSSAVAA